MLNTIIKGDVLETLKTFDDTFIDLTVTSPPYNKQKIGGGIFRKIEYDEFNDSLPEEVYQEQQVNILNELYRVTKVKGSMFYNHKVRYYKGNMIHPMQWLTKTDWHIRQEIVWNKKSAVEVGGYRFYQVEERIYWLYKPENQKKLAGERLNGKDARLTSVWEFVGERKNDHPAPFPLVLPLRCIMSILRDKKGVVLDPYMGSGTTAVAAKLLNQDYIGIDISQNYIDMANERIKNWNSPKNQKILSEEESLHFVKKSYKQRKKELSIKDMFKC